MTLTKNAEMRILGLILSHIHMLATFFVVPISENGRLGAGYRLRASFIIANLLFRVYTYLYVRVFAFAGHGVAQYRTGFGSIPS